MNGIYLTDNVLYYPNLLLLAVVNEEKYIDDLKESINKNIQLKKQS